MKEPSASLYYVLFWGGCGILLVMILYASKTMGAVMKRFRKYLRNVLIAIDQFCNAVWGGDPDETISSRLGKMSERDGGKPRRPLPRLIARILNRIDKGHTKDAIEEDEGENAVFDREEGRSKCTKQ